MAADLKALIQKDTYELPILQQEQYRNHPPVSGKDPGARFPENCQANNPVPFHQAKGKQTEIYIHQYEMPEKRKRISGNKMSLTLFFLQAAVTENNPVYRQK